MDGKSMSQPPDGLGDIVAAAFASVGITKERADKVAKAAGFSGCGCDRRQKKLNDFGRKMFGLGDDPPEG
jgi:hypothetical protein